jgi:two-component system CheB/CheR fusion protein
VEEALKTARLLLVEDDQDTLDLFTLWLSEKYCVFSFRWADEALAALETVKPDLLLLDIGMDPIDGLACLRQIRSNPGYNKVPAIALTGYARDCERESFQAAGFEAVLPKPVLEDDLFVAVAALLAPSDGEASKLPSATAAL